MEQHRLLQHEADLLAERFLLKGADIVSIDLNDARVWIVKAGNQTDERGLPRAGWSYQSGHLAWFNFETNLPEHRMLGVVTKSDLVEFDPTLEIRGIPGTRQIFHLAFHIQNFADTIISHGCF